MLIINVIDFLKPENGIQCERSKQCNRYDDDDDDDDDAAAAAAADDDDDDDDDNLNLQ